MESYPIAADWLVDHGWDREAILLRGSEAGPVRQDATDALRRAGFHAAAAELDCRQLVYERNLYSSVHGRAGFSVREAANLFRRAIAEARSFERAMTRVGQIAPARPPGPPTTSIIS